MCSILMSRNSTSHTSRVGTAHGIDLNLILVVKYLDLVTYNIERNTTKSQIELNGSGRSTSRAVITGVVSNYVSRVTTIPCI